MQFRISLKRILRTPVKMIAYFLITALIAAFLCVGLNLRTHSKANIAAADAAFTTIAIPEFQAHLDYEGKLCREITSPLYEAYGTCPAPEYDLSPIRNAPGVERVDVRGRFGACVNGAEPLQRYQSDFMEAGIFEDVITFTINAEEPVIIYPMLPQMLSITVLSSAAGVEPEAFLDPLELTSSIQSHMLQDMPFPGQAAQPSPPFEMGTEEGDGSFYLEPGKKYIASCELSCTLRMTQQNTVSEAHVSAVRIGTDEYHRGSKIRFYGDDRETWQRDASGWFQPYLPIAPYEEGFFETERGAFFQEIIDANEITANSLNAIATDDFAAMRPFHSGGVHIAQGCAFTEEEYAAGAKVCLVSDYIAALNGWQVGDTLPLSFYETEYVYGRFRETAAFRSPTKDFFDEGEYTIIGLYSGNVATHDMGDRRNYTQGDAIDMCDVIFPANSVANAPAAVPSRDTTSIRLKNSEAQAFMAEMAVSGLMEEQPGGYELGLTVYDQGYSHVAPGLNQLARVSRLTLLLSAGAAGAAVLALALLHVLRMRREIAAMRSLGTKKGQIVVLSLAGILLVCLLGACAGAYAGHMVSAEVAGRVLAGAEEAAVDTTFTAMMGEETAKEFTFTLESDPKLAVAAGGAAVVAFALLALLLLAAELRRPPMCLLAEKE